MPVPAACNLGSLVLVAVAVVVLAMRGSGWDVPGGAGVPGSALALAVALQALRGLHSMDEAARGRRIHETARGRP